MLDNAQPTEPRQSGLRPQVLIMALFCVQKKGCYFWKIQDLCVSINVMGPDYIRGIRVRRKRSLEAGMFREGREL